MVPKGGLRHTQHFPNVFARFCILLKIVPSWRFTLLTLSTPLDTPLCLSCDMHSRPVIDHHIYHILYRLRRLSCSALTLLAP